MRQKKVQVATVSRMALSEVIQRMNNAFRLGHTTDGSAIAIIAIAFVLVDVISKVNNIIDAILASRVAVGIEEAKRIVSTAIHGHVDLADMVVDMRHGLGPTKRARVIAVAYVEAVVVTRESF